MVDDTDDVLAALAAEAYVYLYPLVIADVTRLQQLGHGDGASAHSKSRMNEWQHFRKYPPASFRGVVRPNFDTLYSIAWLDLRGGPDSHSEAHGADGHVHDAKQQPSVVHTVGVDPAGQRARRQRVLGHHQSHAYEEHA